MKSRIAKSLLMLLLLGVTSVYGQSTVNVTDASINAGDKVFWSAGNVYVLQGMVFVEDGAELYIEPGTVIKAEDGVGNNASGLVISQGGKIFAEGTASNPIIFTSVLDDLTGQLDGFDRGLWGGVVMLGYAPTNNATVRQIEGVNEIVGAGDRRADYGGDDPDDNSGILRYVSIRHTGIAVGDQAGNEIQGLTLGGVGRGTTIEYVESFASDDDGFEWFGGTVDAKYLISAFAADDAFDWDEGFNGRGQFWFAIQNTDAAGRMAEMDGAIGDEQGEPYTLPVVMNATYLGDGKDNPNQVEGDGSQGLIFRDNSGGTYGNSIFGDFKGQPGAPALTIEDVANEASQDSRKRLEAGDLKLVNNFWFDFAIGETLESLIPQQFVRDLLGPGAAGNQIINPALRGISRDTDKSLDPRPSQGSAALTGGDRSLYTDPWFTKVDYVGAFGGSNWMKGWTALDQLGYLADSPSGSNVVNVTDSDINAGDKVFWSAGNVYVLQGMVFVEDGAELYIEPGTVIKAEDGVGNNASGLVISQGGKIFAEGTASNPIIFTSVLDDLTGQLDGFDRGLWGGVVMLGYAPTNNATVRQIEGVNEIVGAGDRRADYGGDDPDDNSGILRYVSIRHTGIAVGDQAGNEIQGLTLGGVGRGTTIEYVESFASDDDGFEWFGGTVDAKYLISAFAADDAFDWDEGFNGRGQFWFAIQNTDAAGRMAEMDGAIGDEQGEPYTLPVVMNATYLGDGKDNPNQVEGDGSQGLIFRDNSGGTYGNSIFGDFKGQPGAPALTIEDVANEASQDSRKRLEAGDLKLVNNFWFDFAIGETLESLIPQQFVRDLLGPGAAGNQIINPALRGISRERDGLLDPRPLPGAYTHTAGDRSLFTDPWFTPVDHVGAFGTNNWMIGWTALSQLGYLNNDNIYTNIDEPAFELPKSVVLFQNYPNPFNPSTQIRFELPSNQPVTLRVYDITGRLVSTLVNGLRPAGVNIVSFDASNLASGVYVYRLEGADFAQTRSMTLIK
jgi:trimeric autotransporter adhesin